MMRDTRHARFRQKLRDRQAQWNIHRDRQRILRDQHIDRKLLREIIERRFQKRRQIMNPRRHFARPRFRFPNPRIDFQNRFMPEIRLRHHHRNPRLAIAHPRKPVRHMAFFPQDLRPFRCFQRNPIRSREAS